jgi:hypothetical protein
MKQFFAISSIVLSLAACQAADPQTSGTAQAVGGWCETAPKACDQQMPPMQTWDGIVPPGPSTKYSTVQVWRSPNDPAKVWAVFTDGGTVTAWRELDSQILGAMLNAVVQTTWDDAIIPIFYVRPPPPPPPPVGIAAVFLEMAELQHDAPFLVEEQMYSCPPEL